MRSTVPCEGLLALVVAVWSPCWSAELGLGDALSPESAVKVLSAESEEDLFRTVTSWVESRHPGVRVAVREFQYVADNRALLVLRTISGDGARRAFYFETPGLPVQFIRSKS